MDYIINILQTTTVIYCSFLKLNESKTKKFTIIYPISTILFCTIIIFTKADIYVNLISALFLYFLLPIVLLKIHKKDILYLCLLNVGFLSLSDSLADLLIGLLCSKQFDNIISYTIINLIITITVVILINMPTTKSYIRKFLHADKLIKILSLAEIWALFAFSTIATVIIRINIKASIILTLVILFLLGISVAIAVYIVANNKKKLFYENATATLEKNMKNQIKHYEEKQKMYENLRKFKHDSENLKTGLLILLENNQIEEAKAYLSGFSQQLESKYITVSSGSPVLDALIADKQAEAKKHNITIAFNGLLPYDAIDTLDLCVVFGNALDNAIEACCKISEAEKKTITISVKQNKNLLIINISNPVAKKITVKHNSVRTTKNDSANHGIGIYSIKNTVKKYDGFCELKCHEKVFTLEMGFFIADRVGKAI